jgi:hypothetical protein
MADSMDGYRFMRYAYTILIESNRWEYNTVAYFLKARTVEPEKQPLLANSSGTTFVSRQGR